MGAWPSGPCDGRTVSDSSEPVLTNTNRAFIFIKPHAVTDKVKALLVSRFGESGMKVLAEGAIKAEDIDRKQLIDTHYGAIAAKAVKQKPYDLNVQPEAEALFRSTFGIEWSEALRKRLVFNSVDAATKLMTDFDGLSEKWKKLKKDTGVLKFAGGFYCGKIGEIYVINGFYMDMRRAFTMPGTCIYYYDVEWPAHQLSWAYFRRKVLGGTDPKGAGVGSLRNQIFTDWTTLGLKSEPNVTQNGIHASASPFEGLAERMNWLGVSPSNDSFGQALLGAGIPLTTLLSWTEDPPMDFEGRRQSLFDLLEDLDVQTCLQRASSIAGFG